MIYDKVKLPKLSMPNLSKKKLLLLGFLFVTLLVIPLTVYLVQQQQQSQIKANPNTTLSFVPASQTAAVGAKINLDVLVAPGNNQVNFVKLVVKYDSTKLQATEKSFTLDPTSNLSILQGPTVGKNNLTVVLSVQNDPTKVIQQNTKIGSVSFDVIAASDNPTQVAFDSNQIQVRSINGANQDSFNENVFLSGAPAQVTIQAGDITPTPSVSPSPNPTASPTPNPSLTPTATPTPDPNLTPIPTSTPGATTTPSENSAPICESLTIDKETTGTVPYSVTFTATGTDANGTIDKVTFNYGDGPVDDETTGSGIGTDSVTVPKAHTYQSAGSFTATALLTDNIGGLSDTSSCSATMTISGGGLTTETVTPLPATGPNSTIVGVGALGGILFLIGALLFFVL